MPILANLLGGLFLALAQFLGKRLATSAAIGATMVAVVLGAIAAAYLVVKGLATGIAIVTPPGLVAMTTWVIPGNFAGCVSAAVGTEVTIAVLNLKERLTKALAQVSSAY